MTVGTYMQFWIMVIPGFLGEIWLQPIRINRFSVEEISAVFPDADVDVRDLRRGGYARSPGKVDFHGIRQKRGRQDENHQQDQHDVDQGDDVHLHDRSLVAVGIKAAECHGFA